MTKVTVNLLTEIDGLACPHCGHIQPEVTFKSRKERFICTGCGKMFEVDILISTPFQQPK